MIKFSVTAIAILLLSIQGRKRGNQTTTTHLRQNISPISNFPFLKKGFALGYDDLFMKTTDGGVSWQTLSISGDFNDIHFANPAVGYACGSAGIMLKTLDGGDSWFSLNAATTDNITELYFITPELGYALMYNPNNYVVTIKKTVNGGLTWTIPGSLGTTSTMWDIYFINENVGFASGMGGSKIYRTINGGANWTMQSLGGSGILAIDFVNETTGFITGHDGKIWKTNDTGLSWILLTVPSTSVFKNLTFTNENTGWASGYDGTIVHTTDGGTTWELIPSGTTNQITNMYFMNSGYAWYTTFNNWTGSDIFKFGTSPNDTYDNIIRGEVFVDTDADCVKDVNEPPHTGVVIEVMPGPHYAVTNSAGEFAVQVPAGNYTVQQIPNSYVSLLNEESCPGSYEVNINADTTDTSGFVFANMIEPCPYMITDISSNRRRRCMLNQTVITCYNIGNIEAESPVVTVTFPEYVIPVSSDIPWTMNPDSTYSFQLPDVPAMGVTYIHITDSVACLPELVGRTQCTMASVTPKNACIEFAAEYDGSDIESDAECLVNSYARLSLYNNGEAMSDSAEYRIFLNSELLLTQNYLLGENDTLATVVYSDGQTYRIEADQRPGHPTKLQTNATVEACTKDSAGVFIFGFLPQYPQDDEDPETSIHCLPIRDSYDPNEKTVSPEGIELEHYLSGNTELRYHVCFQNTGNDTAYNIYVIDTLSSWLDMSTFHMGFATHDYTLSFPQSDQTVLRFDFENIYLPDSTTNEPESHGCFDFFIRPQADLLPGTQIGNFVDIYFDFNDPVRTNTAITTILDTAVVYSGSSPLFPELPLTSSDDLICAGDTVTLLCIDTATPIWTAGSNGPIVAYGEQVQLMPVEDVIYVAHVSEDTINFSVTVLREDADFNADGQVSTADLLILLSEYGCEGTCLADLNGDYHVGSGDIIEFLGAIGLTCTTGE